MKLEKQELMKNLLGKLLENVNDYALEDINKFNLLCEQNVNLLVGIGDDVLVTLCIKEIENDKYEVISFSQEPENKKSNRVFKFFNNFKINKNINKNQLYTEYLNNIIYTKENNLL